MNDHDRIAPAGWALALAAFLAAGLAAIAAGPAAATEVPAGLPPEATNLAVQAAWAACKPDIARFCPTVVPGGGRIVRCLVGHANEITPLCREGMLTAKAALAR